MVVLEPVCIPLKNIQLTPGNVLTISEVSWQDYEAILGERGDRHQLRITYHQGILEVMAPSPEHERSARTITDLVKVFLEVEDRGWYDFGSTTLRQETVASGVEPDTCLYIQNADQVADCTRMDLGIYPPPDLAIEADVTSKTTLESYQSLGVPEVWIYEAGKLTIYVLQASRYVETTRSPTFPSLDICDLVPRLVQEAIKNPRFFIGLRRNLEAAMQRPQKPESD